MMKFENHFLQFLANEHFQNKLYTSHVGLVRQGIEAESTKRVGFVGGRTWSG